jgi:hypothetical protein
MYLRVRFIGLLLGSLLAMGQAPMPGRASASAVVGIQANFSSRTSLRVSSSHVQFEVADPLVSPTFVIDFTAAARTIRGGEVQLTVEPIGSVQTADRGGPAAPDLTVLYEGEAGNSGTLSQAGPHVVGRWIGSNARQGRVWFTLCGAQAAGVYTMAVKFVLSAP